MMYPMELLATTWRTWTVVTTKRTKTDEDMVEVFLGDLGGGGGVAGIKKKFRWASSGGLGSMQEDDEKQRKRWTDKAVALLKAAEAPSVLQAMNSSDPDLAMGSLMGRARPMTIQLRVRSWAALVRWLEWRYRCKWPRSAQDLVDYILEMVREGAVASFPRTFSAALTWFEARSGRPSDMKYADNDLLRRTLENVELLVNSGTAPVKKALRFPISVIAALELAVAAEDRLLLGPGS